jgi:alanyl-tRNA synthetase
MENRVNEVILRDSQLQVQQMGREAALAYGALAFFGDKYGESVRVVEVPGFSKEFCGGTHVHQTGQIGLFLVTHEQGISAGNRRVEAVTGAAALDVAQRDQGILEELEQAAKVDRRSLVDEYAKLKEQLNSRERELQALKMKLAQDATVDAVQFTGTLVAHGSEVVSIQTRLYEDLDKRQHATLIDQWRNESKAGSWVLVSTSIHGAESHVIAAVSASLVNRLSAPEVLKELGIRGGGRPEFAQGGGLTRSDVTSLPKRLVPYVQARLGGELQQDLETPSRGIVLS